MVDCGEPKSQKGEHSKNSKNTIPDEDLKEERWLEKSNNVRIKQTARNVEDDYDQAEKDARNEEENLEEVTKKPTVRKLEFDSEPGAEEAFEGKEDDGLPLKCPICSEPFLDPVVTRCNHYFCKHCAQEHHEEARECFVCNQPTTGVFNTAEEIRQRIGQVRDKAKAMMKEVLETVKKASTIVTDAESMKAESAKMVEEVEMIVIIAKTYSVADPMWDNMISMLNDVEDVAAKAKDMAEKAAEMMQEGNAAIETARGEMVKALEMMKNVKWSV